MRRFVLPQKHGLRHRQSAGLHSASSRHPRRTSCPPDERVSWPARGWKWRTCSATSARLFVSSMARRCPPARRRAMIAIETLPHRRSRRSRRAVRRLRSSTCRLTTRAATKLPEVPGPRTSQMA